MSLSGAVEDEATEALRFQLLTAEGAVVADLRAESAEEKEGWVTALAKVAPRYAPPSVAAARTAKSECSPLRGVAGAAEDEEGGGESGVEMQGGMVAEPMSDKLEV